MNMYWVYDYPNWMLFLGLITLFSAFSIIGIFTIREWTDKMLGMTSEDNGVVSEYMGVTGVFFGLVLGMVAVGAWEAYGNAQIMAETEASELGKLYRSVALLPEADGAPLKVEVRRYARVVIDEEWPAQQKGITSSIGDKVVTRIGKMIYALPTDTPKQEIMTSAAVDRYFELVDARRHRIESVAGTRLPGSLWWVVIAATFIMLSLSMLMHLPNRKLDIVLNLLMSLLTGSIMAFIIAMDNPFRGELSVSASAYELIHDRLMTGASK